MKKREYKVTTDHVEIRLVYFEPSAEDFGEQPSVIRAGDLAARSARAEDPYLLIGLPGGQLARVDCNDAALLMVMLERLSTSGVRFRPMMRGHGVIPVDG